ncbi:MAG: alpha-glucosidase/alpha-galactosidase [Oscillospiraceae bacterium]|nr:alpha-glucosidase/alpha-galactosidase [Oscillospiraceae bacterium]
MKKLTVAYIGGGSKGWAHNYFADLLSQDKLEGDLRLYDIDVPAAQRNKNFFDKLVKHNPAKIKSKWTCAVVSDIDKALAGADFVIISILPYTLDNMHVDVHYPEKYGIWQSVGDTVGAGGYSRALRTIPAYIHFAKKIRENCPNAWVINYTNPMAMCMNTLYREFPDIKAFGCCHEVFGTKTLLCRIAGMYLSLSESGKAAFKASDLKAVKAEVSAQGKSFTRLKKFQQFGRDDITANVQGINHFTWINKAEYNGMDLLELYGAFIKMFRENNENRMGSLVPAFVKRIRNNQNVKYTLFEQTGVAAAAGDRHLAEFVPDQFLAQAHIWHEGFGLTPVWLRKLFNGFRRFTTALADTPLYNPRIKGTDEEGVDQMTAICGLRELTTNVNMPNRGQQGNIVMNAAVETDAVFSLDSVAALDAGDMTPESAALVNIHAQNQLDFVEAYFQRDVDALEEVFCRDPQVARIGRENGKKLFAEMRAMNRECLEDFLL